MRPPAFSLTRRDLLTGLGGSLALAAAGVRAPQAQVRTPPRRRRTTEPQLPIPQVPMTLPDEDERLLDEIERATFSFFWEQSNPTTGLVRDRFNVRAASDSRTAASIAATGFGLTALCIGAQREYVPVEEARARVVAALQFLDTGMPTHRGFYYHFADVHTGARIWDSEISSIDTAILLCGVLTCGEYFGDEEVSDLATRIFERADWTWLSADTTLLPHGWRPEAGFLQYRWDVYSELMMMYLLGLGSTTFPLPVETWHAWQRTVFEYDGLRYIGSFAPLFVHQYSQAWFDFRGRRDRYADYFENSVIATEVHRRFCLELAERFPHFSEDLWGITASDSVNGYVIWGGPPEMGPLDGTVVPSAAAGSLPFLPAETLRVLRNIRTNYDGAWSRYGFVNAFNPMTGWYDPDVVGIDTGITLLMAENLRTGFVWETFTRNENVTRALQRAGFTRYR